MVDCDMAVMTMASSPKGMRFELPKSHPTLTTFADPSHAMSRQPMHKTETRLEIPSVTRNKLKIPETTHHGSRSPSVSETL